MNPCVRPMSICRIAQKNRTLYASEPWLSVFRHGVIEKLLLFLSAVLLTTNAVRADTISLVSETRPLVIPLSQTREVQFGTVPQANTTVLLKIKSRMDYKELSGSLHFLRLTLNGRVVEPAKSRFAQRLLNKPLSSPVEANLTVKWCENGVWNVLYAPDFRAAYAHKHYVGDPYLYVLDVTDLVNPLAENRLIIANMAELGFVRNNKFPNDKLDLMIGSLVIETKAGASPMMAGPATAAQVVNHGEPAAGPAPYRGELLPGGGFALHLGQSVYRFTSSISFPNRGFNRLSAGRAAPGGQRTWKVSTEGNRVIAQGPDYAVARTVCFNPNCVRITDAITNRHQEVPLGLSVRHEMDLSALKNAPVRLAGNPDPALAVYHSYGNPSVHVVIPEGGMGLIAEDEVLRRQAQLYVRNEEEKHSMVAGIRTEMLFLAPGETYTLQWAVYPVAGPDYYDFINLVRDDWGANYTVFGPWRWGFGDMSKPVEEIRARIKRQGIHYFIDSDWVEWAPNARGTQRIAFGSDVFSDYWANQRKKSLELIKKLRQAAPDVKILGYYNALRESADDTPKRFSGSLLMDQNGAAATTNWTYTGATNLSYLMVPTLKNTHGKAMLETARRYMDEMTWDGIYWDEAEGVAFGQIMITHNNFDGHSCVLDPKTWRLVREVGNVPLTTQPFRDEVVRLVRAKGGPMLCNGPTGSRHTLRDCVQRMVEVQHNDYYAFEGNLQSPLGYMCSRDSWDDFLRAFQMAMLPAVCLRTELPHDISPYLFPFTPVELHAGYLLGKERLVATLSGNYGWPALRSLVRVRHFNNTGKLTATDFPTIIDSEARTAVTLQAKEAVVLERLPLKFEPAEKEVAAKGSAWHAEVRQVRYGADAVSLDLRAPQGGVLRIDSGEFPLPNGTAIMANLGSKSQAMTVAGCTLRIAVPAGFSSAITVRRQ